MPSINFPHLGIEIGYFPNEIHIGNFSIAFYGILIAIGIVIGTIVVLKRVKTTGQYVDDYIDLILAGIIFGVIGARLYYVLFSLDYYIEYPSEIINIRSGGLAIYGTIIGAFISTFIVCRVKKISYLRVLDTCAPGFLIGQALGRWGNFFNREAFGRYTDSLFAMQIKYDEVGGVVSDDILKNISEINGIEYIQVTPAFLYESLWCVMVLVLILVFRKYQKYSGEVVLWYVGGYALGRAWIEGLRTDQLLIGHTDIAISQVLSIAIVAGALTVLIINRIRLKKGWVPDFKLILDVDDVGTAEYAKARKAARKEKKAQKFAEKHNGKEKKDASSWEKYKVKKEAGEEKDMDDSENKNPSEIANEVPEENITTENVPKTETSQEKEENEN